jgi:hypothetical protein
MLPLQRLSLTTNVKSFVAARSEAKEQGDHGGAELSSNTKGTTNRLVVDPVSRQQQIPKEAALRF